VLLHKRVYGGLAVLILDVARVPGEIFVIVFWLLRKGIFGIGRLGRVDGSDILLLVLLLFDFHIFLFLICFSLPRALSLDGGLFLALHDEYDDHNYHNSNTDS